MDDLISRQAAIDALKDMYHAAEKWREEASDDVIKARAESCMTSLIEMKLRIEKLPSAQPERKTGKWIVHFDDLFPAESTEECSICHAEQLINGNDDNFCPNCGAEMEEQ